MARKILAIAIAVLLLPAVVLAQEASRQETEQLDFAQGLLARGLYPMAVNEYQKFIAAYPKSAFAQEAYLAIGEAFFQAKEYPKAADAFNQFKTLFPQDILLSRATLRLAQMALLDKKYDEALILLQSIALDKMTDTLQSQEINYYLGKAYLGKGDLDQALKFFQAATAALETGKLSAYAYGDAGGIYLTKNDYANAINAFSKAVLSSTEESVKGYFMFQLAQSVFLSGNYEKAASEFLEIINKYPALPEQPQAINNLLLAHLNRSKYDEVIKNYEQLQASIKEEGKYAPAHLVAVRAYIGLKNYDQALALIDRIVALQGISDSDKTMALLKRADIFIIQKKYQHAQEILAAQTAVGSHQDEFLYLTAQAQYGLGQFEGAAKTFDELVKQFPQSDFAKAATLGRAHSNGQGGKFKEAGEDFLQFAASDTNSDLKAEALFDAAIMASKQQSYEEAINRLKQFLSAFPNSPRHEQSVLMLSDLYAKTQQSMQAIDFVNGYIALHPEAAGKDGFNFTLGYNYQRLGQLDKALEFYSKVVGQGEDKAVLIGALKNAAAISLEQQHDAMAMAFFDRVMSEETTNSLPLKTFLWVCDKYLSQQQYSEVLRIAGLASKSFGDEGKVEFAYFKAEAQRGLKDFPNALTAYDEVIASKRRDMYSGGALIGKGIILTAEGQYEEAAKLFSQALAENAEDNTITLRARYESGNTALAAGQQEVALNFYLLVATLYENEEYCPQSLLKAGTLLTALNRKAEAVKTFNEILEKYKDSSLAAQAKERLVSLQ